MSRRTRRLLHPVIAGAVVLGLLGGCADGSGSTESGSPTSTSDERTSTAPSAPTSTAVGPTTSATPAPSPTPSQTTPPTTPPAASPPDRPFGGRHVVAISVDGLSPDALEILGRDGAPAIWSLIDNGAATLDARSEVEMTVTLPNHVGMVTGRPIDPAGGGHGVTWNEEIPGRTVQQAAGHPVESVFDVVHAAGGSTAVFAGKSKLNLFETSWPDAVDTTTIADDIGALTTDVTVDLAQQQRTFTFVHVADPDQVGHLAGWLSPRYLAAVRRADAFVRAVIDTIRSSPDLQDNTVVVLTADHGGQGSGHSDPTVPADYTVPFVVVGDGVRQGDLYALSPGLEDPGTTRPGYDGRQPVRNCDLANVSLRALGLRPVADSRCLGYRTMPVRRP